jgi:hypothetical protein
MLPEALAALLLLRLEEAQALAERSWLLLAQPLQPVLPVMLPLTVPEVLPAPPAKLLLLPEKLTVAVSLGACPLPVALTVGSTLLLTESLLEREAPQEREEEEQGEALSTPLALLLPEAVLEGSRLQDMLGELLPVTCQAEALPPAVTVLLAVAVTEAVELSVPAPLLELPLGLPVGDWEAEGEPE